MTRQQAAIKQARAQYQNDDCEIDDDAVFSEAKESGGVWVSAWVWVSDEEIGNQQVDNAVVSMSSLFKRGCR